MADCDDGKTNEFLISAQWIALFGYQTVTNAAVQSVYTSTVKLALGYVSESICKLQNKKVKQWGDFSDSVRLICKCVLRIAGEHHLP